MIKTNILYLTITALTFISAPVKAVETADTKVEQCVDELRKAPSIFEGSITFDNYNFSQIWLPEKEISEKFSECISTVLKEHPTILDFLNNESFSGRASDFRFISHKSNQPRYLFSDSYQRKYLLDLTEKRSYELVRIPRPGSIESLGTWDGTFKDPIGRCENSYGDDCGTVYERDPDTGGYRKKY